MTTNQIEKTIYSEKIKSLVKSVLLITPIIYTWLIAAFFLLIYSFDMISYVESNNLALLQPVELNEALTFGSMVVVTLFSIIVTGMTIDKKPAYLRLLMTTGLIGSSLSVLLVVFCLVIKFALLLVLSISLVGLFLGVLSCSSATYFAVSFNWRVRGKVYGLVIFIFGSLAIIIFLLSADDFFTTLILVGLIGLIFGLLFFFTIKNEKFWVNDKWPTKFSEIIGRFTVKAYFTSHFLIYLMLGLLIGSISQIVNLVNLDDLLFFSPLDFYKRFWGIVLGSLVVFAFPAGYLSDKRGRKNSMIFGIYSIVFASLIIGLLNHSAFSFILAGIILGISLAFIQTSLSSALWGDLSPKDSIGRYSSIGFLSLTLGLAIGFGTGYKLFNTELWAALLDPTIINVNSFLLIVLAICAALPLFWVSDSSPPLKFFLLLVINSAGIPIFHYHFKKKTKLKVDLTLISGALTAVGSFMTEATGERNASLNLVRHGSHFILSNTSSLGVTSVIFANKNDYELFGLLNKFIQKFEQRFSEEIESWAGNLNIFDDAVNYAEEIFGPLVTMDNSDQ